MGLAVGQRHKAIANLTGSTGNSFRLVQARLILRLDSRLAAPAHFGSATVFASRYRSLGSHSYVQNRLTGSGAGHFVPGFIQTRFLAQKPRTLTLTSLVCLWIL
jgi:hypothetical protein